MASIGSDPIISWPDELEKGYYVPDLSTVKL